MTDPAYITAIGAMIAALISSIIALMTARNSARKDQIVLLQEENEKLYKKIADLRLEIDKMTKEQNERDNQYRLKLRALQDENDELRQLIAELTKQVLDLGGVPKKVARQ